ncbi:MAG TPA: glycosyltransferase family 39 protein [Chitinophagales bacterium]|nr:glycosyltransferase family 39 protein [Chitinophagales bacterium]
MKVASQYQLLFALLIFLILSVLYYYQMVTWLPASIHYWAQADRYALAINFYDNGLNFFEPATNSEFSVKGITAPEFPLQSYLAACLAKIFGRNNISPLFRLITLSFSAAAFMVLFQWGKRMHQNFFISLLCPVFLFTSPVFVFYSCNYLPDAAALSLLLVSFYFLYLFSNDLTFRNGLFTVLFAGIATLIKMSSGVYFAVICLHGMIIIFKHYRTFGIKNILRLTASGLITALIIGLYFLHIRRMEGIYHSGIFLSAPMPLDTAAHGYGIFIRLVLERWGYDYFTGAHYAVLLIALGIILYSLRKASVHRFFFFQWLLNLVAAIGGFLVMGEQFFVHDYYVMVIFFPAMVFTILFVANLIEPHLPAARAKLLTGGIILAMIAMGVMGFEKHSLRLIQRKDGDWSTRIKTSFDQYNIAKDEKILITSGDAPNTGLVYADRRGLTVNLSLHESVPNFLLRLMRNKKLKYLVMSPEQVDSLEKHDSCFFKYMDAVVRNEEVGIFRYRGTMEDQYWTRSIVMDGEKKELTTFTSFECPYNCLPKSPEARTGNYSLALNDQMMFMPDLNVFLDEIPDTTNLVARVKFWVRTNTQGNLNLVLQSVRNDSIFNYHILHLPVTGDNKDLWREAAATVPFPAIDKRAHAIQIYLWDPEGLDVRIDDFVVKFENSK